jgi:hypothetical protein
MRTATLIGPMLLACAIAAFAGAMQPAPANQPTPPATTTPASTPPTTPSTTPTPAPAAASPAGHAHGPEGDRTQWVEDWREDLRTLAAELPTKHIRLFHTLGESEFLGDIAKLENDLPNLPDHLICGRIMQLLAKVRDAHTFVQTPPGFTTLPIGLGAFNDGVFVILAAPQHESILGGKVVAVGGVPIEQAIDRAASVIPRDSEVLVRAHLPRVLTTPELLHTVGLAEGKDSASFTIEHAGHNVEVRLNATTPGRTEGWRSALSLDKIPLWLSDQRTPFWTRSLDDNKLFYIAYNRCEDPKGTTLKALIDAALRQIDELKPAKVLIDLRNNPGGNSRLLDPLIVGLGTRRDLNTRGHIFVATGPRTLSSAMMNAHQFRMGTKALLVGEPTGGRPNHFGEVRALTLPHTKLVIGYPIRKFIQITTDDPPAISPDIPVALTSEDFFAGRDPVLDAARLYKE